MSADVTRTRVASIEICATTEKQVSMRDRTRFCPEVLGASPGEVCESEMICESYPVDSLQWKMPLLFVMKNIILR